MPPKPTYFSYTSRTFIPEENKILFSYESGFESGEPLKFTEAVTLPDLPRKAIPNELLERLLDDVHVMLGISYYKLYCPPEIRIPYTLSDTQAFFWETVYRKGLGEFAYRNNLDLRERIKFPRSDAVVPTRIEFPRSDRALVGIGGGKDSIVALELLKEQKTACDGFVVETYAKHDIADNVCEIAGIKALKIVRMLDQKVLKPLPGSFNGHIPISAIYAFLGVLAAALYDYRYVVVSNEHSSNFGNVDYLGETINHQWSKSAEFEKMFQEYVRTFVTDSVTYFSIARPFYEIRIAEMLAKYPKYFPHFTGCNRKFRIDSDRRPKGMWCCECPKCAFVFLILAPFIPKKTLIGIFGKDMLDDRALTPLFQDILGFGTMKPFDCVGTFEEAQAALYIARDVFADSAVVKELLPKILDGEKQATQVMQTQQALTVPTQFRFCGMKSALILGYGKEGKINEQYLRSRHLQLAVETADQSDDDNYLKRQDTSDIVIKTPGIPKEKVHAQYVTATNIFFSQVKNPVIGVTGSKGKSTTASLIYAILKESGKKVRLAGNIGEPMLELLTKGLEEDEVVVLELSSYQLDDIEFSPHIAVVTNLFPEHMDYHGDVERYYAAKKNILRYQKSDDLFIYNPNVQELSKWADTARGKSIPFAELPFRDSIQLLGEHNRDNVRAAITVAQNLGIRGDAIERVVKDFKGLPHRLEFIGEFKEIRFFDDAISTTPESTIAALRAVSNVGTIFLGGHDRGYDFTELEKEIRVHGIKNIVLFPETGKRMFADRKGLNILETESMEEAVAFAYKNTPKGAACLLSCASPSYGLWKNFEEKGNEFKNHVKSLAR